MYRNSLVLLPIGLHLQQGAAENRRRLMSFGASSKVLSLFYKATIQSILQYGSVWFGALSAQLRARILRLLWIHSKSVGHSVESTFFETNRHPVRLADKITLDPYHVLQGEYQLLPSGRCYRVPKCRKVNTKPYFVPLSISLLNQYRAPFPESIVSLRGSLKPSLLTTPPGVLVERHERR